MASLEDDFPRGGIIKKPAGSKSARQKVEVDNLFAVHEPEQKKKRKSAKEVDEIKAKKKKFKEDHLKLNATNNIDILHFKSLKVGTLLLGCVKEVTNFAVTVSLPSGLTGYLPIANISESYTKILSEQLDSGNNLDEILALPCLFSPGMLIRCALASLETAKAGHVSLRVTVNPKEVNKGLSSGSLKAGMLLSGCVESIEDHGFLIDIGLSGTKAFLPKAKDIAKAAHQADLKVGQYLHCLLEEVKNGGRVARVSISPPAIARACAETQHGWTLSSLLPGLVVKAQIKQVSPHGMILEFLSSFRGSVDFMHVDPDKASSYSPGDSVKACILYIEPGTHTVGLSLRSHLLQPGGAVEPVMSDRIGEVVRGCRMAAMHYHSGAVLELPEETLAFVHKSHIKEPNQMFNPNRVKAIAALDCRITGFSPLEQMHLASLRRSIIEAAFLRYQDLQPGQIVEGTVTSLQSFGMEVKLSEHVKGMVPRTHLADVLLSHPEKKYSVGNRVKCRVLTVEPRVRKLVMTRKKALVESTLPLIRSYADARVGRVAHGFIVCVKDFGCIVRFYDNVKGLVPVRELTSEPVVVPAELFYVGQVVKAKVLSCDAEREKLLLSFKAVADGVTEAAENFSFEIGKNVEARLVKKVPTGLGVSILPEEASALLPTAHLSDHVSNCGLLWEALREGDVISNVLCLSRNKQSIVLTKKPLVKAALQDGVVAREFSEIQVGMELIGWIKNVMPYGVFVEFPHGLVGLAPISAMCDRFLSSTSAPFQPGQTVVAKVTNLDKEKQRFLVTLKVSEVGDEAERDRARLVQGLKEREAVTEMMATRAESELLQFLSTLTLGHTLKMTVEEVKDDGTAKLVAGQPEGATVLATKYHVTDVTVTPGQNVTGVVLHVDLFTSHVYVSLLSRLVANKKTLQADANLLATVEYVEQDFAVISLGDTGHLTMVHTAAHLNEYLKESEKLCPGKTFAVTVKEPSCEELGGLPLVARGSLKSPVAKKREAPVSAASAPDSEVPRGPKHAYRVGDTVTGTVRSVRPTSALVSLENGVTGLVHVSDISDAVKPGSFPTSSLKVGAAVTARVVGGKEARSHKFLPISHPNFTFTMPQLSLLSPSKVKEDDPLQQTSTKEQLKRYQPGEEVVCFVSKFDKPKKFLDVALTPSVNGSVELLAMTLDPKEAKHPEKFFKLGQALKATVVGLHSSKKWLSLSLTGTHSLVEGVRTLGTVKKVVPHVGLVVTLPFRRTGLASLVDLADSYRPSPLDHYSEGQVVRCCVVGEENDKLQLSLRPSRAHPEKALPVKDAEVLSIDDLKVGQNVRGYVKSVGDQGVFVRLSRTITGRVKFQEVTSFFVRDHSLYSKHILPSSLFTTKVLSVDKENGQVDLSLLPEDTGKPDVLPESLGLPQRLRGEEKEKHDAAQRKRKRTASESEPVRADASAKNQRKEKKTKGGRPEENDSGVEVYFREEEEDNEDVKPEKKSAPAAPVVPEGGPVRLQVAGGFSWDVALSSLRPATAGIGADSSEDEDEEEQAKPQKKSRREREQEQQRAESALAQREGELMDPGRRPQSAAGFERLVLGSPDSSLLWLQYMAFHLQAAEIEQARAVAERALKTISFREEREKLNVWVALLNLENLYGSADSLRAAFERALQFCEPLPVYQQLADIYATSGKHKEAEDLYRNMAKRFRQERAVWLSYGSYLLRQGQSDAAHALLQRALKSLPVKEHVDLIAKFAQLEFQHGDAERAKSMFDRTLTSYPKRTDLWSVYLDLMVKHGTQKEVRALFDRVIHLSVAVKRIKFFFKRYLEYEKKHGTPESVQAVKEKALEYVEAKGPGEAS
ncbi:protein RRP5 homolog [Anguilla rostrata]|uniref:protein RRP5 homolog n=1 Tax=Anguilla rostrata TaxID=7938 RepID=UPI0030CDC024